tara:strand:+ start:6371 stop:7237 length:867 start_codon:yes stop_codon:yes gene_type:complete
MKLNFLNRIYSLFSIKKSIYLIESNEDIVFLKEILTSEALLGLDTEFDWRNTYFPILSMLQISTRNKVLLIDCIKLKNLNFLKKILEDRKKIIIFHSSRSDTTVLSTNLNIKIINAFDIQIAENIISGGDIKNYGAIVKKYMYKNLEQSQTKSNWLLRPFSNEQLSYAAEDVDFLLDIYDKQVRKLNKLNKLNIVIEKSKLEASKGNQELYVSRIQKLKKPSRLEKEIFMWREKYASKKNVPPSQILNNKDLKVLINKVQSKKMDKNSYKGFFKDRLIAEDLLKYIEL